MGYQKHDLILSNKIIPRDDTNIFDSRRMCMIDVTLLCLNRKCLVMPINITRRLEDKKFPKEFWLRTF